MPDGLSTGPIGIHDTLVIEFPRMIAGDEICMMLGFNDLDGIAVIELNGLGSYRFENTAGLDNLELQQFCFETINDGPQTIFIRRDGAGSIALDGSIYEYCPCTPSDPFYNSSTCQCVNNQQQTPVDYEYDQNVGGTPSNAAGLPDGLFTGNIAGLNDTLVLSFPQVISYAEICVTVGFSDPLSVFAIEQSDQIYTFQNATGQANHVAQEFCFPAPEIITNHTLRLTDVGPGSFIFDGAYMNSCIPCGPNDQDSDNDGICDANDTCPFSATGDSDGDGVCDDADICPGFDDAYDSDGDGFPNGCDVCFGYNDNIDTDGEGVPNGCDICEGEDDTNDFDNDGIPNACDLEPCSNFILENTTSLIVLDQEAHIHIHTDGYVENNSNFNYNAGSSILLANGFEVEAGGAFHAFISPCQ